MKPFEIYLESFGIVSEEVFNELINQLPKVNFNEVYFDDYESDSEGIVNAIMEQFLRENTKIACVRKLNFNDKEIDIVDIEDYEELGKVKSILLSYGWNISNLDYLESIISENKEEHEYENLLSQIKDKATIEQLKKFVSNL